ncbi:MAG: Lrp/AsnC ligand binding domain-containing protein [Candidatus Hydrothermarchaeales archaeon]
MVVAGVLIRTAPGKTKSAIEELRKLEGMISVQAVFGRFDVVAMIEAKDLDEAANTVVSKIRQIDGVTYTETLIAAKI